MDTREKNHAELAPSRSLREAILEERLKEAENIERATDRRGSELARLEILEANLGDAFDDIPEADDRFALLLSPSEPARLWVDMMAYVAMDATARTYRFIWNGGAGRRVLAESEDVAEMKAHILNYVAGQIVARERQIQGLAERQTPSPPNASQTKRNIGVVIWAFAIGLLTGAFCLLALAYLITP